MYNNLPPSMNNDYSSSMQKVEMFLSGRSLLDMDFFSKSDPYVRVFFKSNPVSKPNLIGRTETVMDNLNPNFRKSFLLDYIFETKQEIRF